MSWRDALLRHFGAGLLGGITLGDWFKLLCENRFAVAPSGLLRAMAITWQALQNSPAAWLENWRYRNKLKDVEVPPPLFLLGHWRNGTTHLYNLLTIDDRFAFPNNFQALFPHAFLATEAVHSRLISFFLPKRRPMDNVEWNMQSPQEDEFALLTLSRLSPCLGWVFPKRREHYDRYLTFRDATEAETVRWKTAFTCFTRKLTWKYRKPLILKSPTHTPRIKLLLELFPQAKFVHIHRNPYAVFPSTRHTLQVNFHLHNVQRPRMDDLDERILRQYAIMYDAFFQERGLVATGHFHEVGYEDLEVDPIGQVRGIYDALQLPDFSHVEPALRKYVDSITGYQKNRFRELPEELRRRIAAAWRPYFEAWGYPT